jgi:hypothetical protein
LRQINLGTGDIAGVLQENLIGVGATGDVTGKSFDFLGLPGT